MQKLMEATTNANRNNLRPRNTSSGDEQQPCRFCSLALPIPLDELVSHYALHDPITADYLYKGVRYVELLERPGEATAQSFNLEKTTVSSSA